MASITFENLTRQYPGNPHPSVVGLDLEIHDGEFLVLVGPSGCGKSTTLRMLAGLEPIDDGRLLMDGRDVTGQKASQRDVAMVFQSYALYPNMTARQNMAFALQNRKVPRGRITELVEEASRILQLDDLMERRPAAMSGGQRQRVAMGRAIVRQPQVFCMDEPLSNLDAQLRVSTRAQIAELQRRLGTTTVFVTHDQTEAMTLGDRVCVLNAGLLQQVGTPQQLYSKPRNTFVAEFIGTPAITLVEGVPVRDGAAHLGDTGHRIALPAGASDAGPVLTVGLRPEAWRTVSLESHPGALQITVALVEDLGADQFAYGLPARPTEGVTVRGGRVCVRLPRGHRVEPGETLAVEPVIDDAYLFHAETGLNLRSV
ncbi:ATP-binding cassette domain-containing protein [Citricoccus sp. NPDC079358]|jgi:ABC-type sugar transport system ATPase subunit|uniref:ABC transporter ATP-binding protein n=1 Tax=Citricoccus sp. NPDC079358 TaxID=3154653 RepID=UPI003450F1CF